MPQTRTLYEPSTEHDACGFGFVVDIAGRASHAIVRDALTVLVNLEHRGASGSEANTGDGAGLLVAIPHGFLRAVAADAGVALPAARLRRGHGLPARATSRAATAPASASSRASPPRASQLLGWRDVPTDPTGLGAAAAGQPAVIAQAFIARPADLPGPRTATSPSTAACTSRRRLIEKAVARSALPGRGDFYVPSMSCRTMVYKGMLNAPQLLTFYPDLARRAARERDRPRPLALLDQHVPVSWARAHPYRYISHNGEINTLRGNVNWMFARQSTFTIVGVRRRPDEGPAGGRRRRLRHHDLRQRARAAPPVRPEPRPRDDDDGPRAVGPRHAAWRPSSGRSTSTTRA